MLRFLIDTDVAIALLRRSSSLDISQLAAHDGTLAISTVSLFELEFGSERSTDPTASRKAVEGMLGILKVIDFDKVAAAHSGEIRATLARAGTPIGKYDLQIAGLARSRGLTVVTGNTREFERVPGLLVENWMRSE